MTAELCYRVGRAIAYDILECNLPPLVFIGKDTRPSGDMLSYSIACGLVDGGVDVNMLGTLSTGGVSYLASISDVGYAVMVTASHNDSTMNGIKVIDSLGYKIEDSVAKRLERYIDSPDLPKASIQGKITHNYELVDKYISACLDICHDLKGLSIVLDPGNGCMGDIARNVLITLGANVIPINFKLSDGDKINDHCGAQHPEMLIGEVAIHHADFGIAFDGDADRLLVVDSTGHILTGDDLLFALALHLDSQNRLNSRAVVGTVMTNKGVEDSLKQFGIKMYRTPVGDSNVINMLRLKNLSIGAESSGHICMPKLNTTCDALMNALFFLNIAKSVDISRYLVYLKRVPQVTKNIVVDTSLREYVTSKPFQKYIKKQECTRDDLRIVVRPSGTEQCVRIMVECNNVKALYETLDVIERQILSHSC